MISPLFRIEMIRCCELGSSGGNSSLPRVRQSGSIMGSSETSASVVESSELTTGCIYGLFSPALRHCHKCHGPV